MIFHFIRRIAQITGKKSPKWDLSWIVRHELGETFGRPHFHFLLVDPFNSSNPVADCHRLSHIWQREVAGAAGDKNDIRIYDPSLSAVDYIMKADQGWFSAQANQYEIAKFYFDNIENLDLPLLIAPRVLWDLSKISRKRGSRNEATGLAGYLRSLKGRKRMPAYTRRNSAPHPERFAHFADPTVRR